MSKQPKTSREGDLARLARPPAPDGNSLGSPLAVGAQPVPPNDQAADPVIGPIGQLQDRVKPPEQQG